MKRLLFVVNPCAGMKRIQRYLAEIIAMFTKYGYENTVYMTAGRGDATEIVQRRAQDADLVVCAGGDGTFNEVVAGLMQSGLERPLGYIPAGSTNDFASSLHLPKQILAAAEGIMRGTAHTYDVGRFNGRYFSYVASCGMFTRASYSTPQNVKNALGHLAYILEGIKELSNIRKMPLRVETEAKTFEDEYLFAAVSNSTSVGGILTLDEALVDLNDGQFELMLLRAPRNIHELNECVLALRNQRYDCAMLTFCPARKLRITAPPEVDWTLDGELCPGSGQIEIENLHSAITLLQQKPEEL